MLSYDPLSWSVDQWIWWISLLWLCYTIHQSRFLQTWLRFLTSWSGFDLGGPDLIRCSLNRKSSSHKLKRSERPAPAGLEESREFCCELPMELPAASGTWKHCMTNLQEKRRGTLGLNHKEISSANSLGAWKRTSNLSWELCSWPTPWFQAGETQHRELS